MSEQNLEQQLILHAGRYGWKHGYRPSDFDTRLLAQQHDLDWSWVTMQLYRHRLMSLGWRMLSGPWADAGGQLPRGYALYETWYRAMRHRNELMCREIERFNAALAEAGITTVLRRGPALINGVYDDPGLRPMSDIDILVDPAQEDSFMRVMRGLGFELGNISPNKASILPSVAPKDRFHRLIRETGDTMLPLVIVDPSSRLTESLSIPNLGSEELFACAEPAGEGLGSAKTMALHHLVIDLCTHLYEESTTASYVRKGRFQRILQYVDILACLARPEFEWSRLVKACSDHGLSTQAYFALGNARGLYPDGPVSQDMVDILRDTTTVGSRFLDEYGDYESGRQSWPVSVTERMFLESW
jgi:hypothetical protein